MQAEVRESCRKLPGAPPPFRASSPSSLRSYLFLAFPFILLSFGPSKSSVFLPSFRCFPSPVSFLWPEQRPSHNTKPGFKHTKAYSATLIFVRKSSTRLRRSNSCPEVYRDKDLSGVHPVCALHPSSALPLVDIQNVTGDGKSHRKKKGN